MRASGVRLTILALAALVSTPATAADLPAAVAPINPPPFSAAWSRFYLSLHGGIGLLQSTSLDYVDGALPSRSVDFNPGWTVVGAAGFQVTPWWRTEVEVGGRGNGVRNISPGTGPGGSVQATTLMLNGYLDIQNQGPVTPYVGAGFGKAWISHSLTVDGATLTPGTTRVGRGPTSSWPEPISQLRPAGRLASNIDSSAPSVACFRTPRGSSTTPTTTISRS